MPELTEVKTFSFIITPNRGEYEIAGGWDTDHITGLDRTYGYTNYDTVD
jgi:hypothetical protein